MAFRQSDPVFTGNALDATRLRHARQYTNDFNVITRTENPRVGGSIPPLGTSTSKNICNIK